MLTQVIMKGMIKEFVVIASSISLYIERKIRRSSFVIYIVGYFENFSHAQETCASFLYKKHSSKFDANHKKQQQTMQSIKQQIIKSLQTSRPRHLSILVTCLQVSCVKTAVFYLMQDSCTRKNLYKKAWHSQVVYTSQFVQVYCTRFLTVCHRHKYCLLPCGHIWTTMVFLRSQIRNINMEICGQSKIGEN